MLNALRAGGNCRGAVVMAASFRCRADKTVRRSAFFFVAAHPFSLCVRRVFGLL